MKTNLKRVLSFVLVMMLILSCVPTMAFAAENSTAYAAQNITTGAEYDSLASAMEAAEAGQTVKALADCAEPVSYKDGVILDLNGHALTNVTVAADATVTAIDSATDDYKGSFGTLSGDIAGTVAATVKTAEPKTYISVCENGSWSFHRYYASITAISLKPASAALGYKAEFYGDEAVKNAVVSYGYELWVNNNAPKALSKSDKLEKSVLTLRLQNILKEGNAALNAAGSTATINGKAFITLNLNGKEVTLYGAEQSTTLRSTIEAINANVKAYSESALQAVRNLCTTYADWMNGWATENIFGVAEGEGDLNVEITVDVTAENNVVTEAVVLRYEDIVATVPAGTQLTEGTTSLKLTIVDKNASDSGIAENEGETLRPLDVHIAGISEDNTAPIIICLGQILPKALNIGNYELYHVEGEQTVPMTHVNASALDAHNEFTYDPATGAVTVAMASFSEVALKSTAAQWTGGSEAPVQNGNTYYIYNADQLQGLSDLVANGTTFAGDTVILMADITFAGETEDESLIFYPIGHYYKRDADGNILYETNGNITYSNFQSFEGTFDGNGHTISNLYQQTWAMIGDYNSGYTAGSNYYKDGMGLFGYVVDGTVKNLTMDKFVSVGEFAPTGCIAAYAKGNCTFENISLRNCHPATYNTGVAGIVGWDDGGDDETDAEKTHYIYKNITIDETNEIEALWGSWDVAAAGLQGYLAPYSTAYLENCHLAPTINVYNDVCGNYQYYWYRYCGMFIGTVDKTDANGVLDLSNITAKNCTADFGDRHEYYYCEFVKNSIASYTHDYQFSRVNNADITVTNGVPACNHDHEARGTQQINGNTVLVEDKQAVYIPFRQLFGGYGWGVDGVDEYENIEITTLNASAVKFESVLDNTNILTDSIMTIGQLFKVKDGVTLDIDNVQVFISPANESSTAGGTYVANTENWAEGTLTFSGEGAAEIIITDYYFCVETKLTVNVIANTVTLHYADGFQRVTFGESTTLPQVADFEGKAFVGWTAEEMPEENETCPAIKTADTVYDVQGDTHLFAVYTYETTLPGGNDTWNLVTDAATLAIGDEIVIAASGSNHALGTTQNSNNRAAVSITKSGNTITINESVQIITLENGKVADTFAFYTGSGYLYAASSSSNYLRTKTTLDDNGSWSISIAANGVATVTANGTNTHNWLRKNSSSALFSCYEGGQNDISIYKKVSGEEQTKQVYNTIVKPCDNHTSTSIVVPATCTEAGYTKTFCADCGATISKVEIPALGHSYVDGVCSVCDAVKATNATITFDNTNKRTELSAAKQVWEENGITVTNTSATNNIADYSNPVRFYKNTIVVVEFPEMTKIEVVCSSESYATALQGSIEGSVKNGTTVIISFAATNSYTMTMSADQVRVNSITVYTEDGTSSVCDHIGAETTTTTIPASCTENGATIVTCNNCGTEIGNTVIPALDHTFVDGVCSACNSVEVIFPDNIPESGVYKKVTDVNEIICGGLFVIVAEADGTYYAMNQYGSGKVSSVPVTVSGNYVTTETAPTWLIGTYGANGQIAIKTNENNYLAHTKTAGTDMHDGRKTFGWIIEANDANNAFHIVSSADDARAIIFRTGEGFDCFKAYALSNIGTTSYYADLQLYKLVEGEIAECEHTNTSVNTVAPSCTEAGSITETCDDCGETISVETIKATGHSYTYTDNKDGTHTIGCENCDYSESADHEFTAGECVCGAEEPTSTTATESMNIFGSTGTLASNNSSISWTSGDITFTNVKGSTAIRTSDSDHYRIYANSTVTISATKITKIVFTCTSNSYATVLQTSLNDAGYTATVSGQVVTVEIADGSDSITFTASAQTRVSKIEVTYNG